MGKKKIPHSGIGQTSGFCHNIQTSPDLVNWTMVLVDPNLNNNAGSVSHTLNGTGKQFVRLVVTPN